MGDSDDDFAGRWILLSGATSGLGRAIAQALAARNARLLLLGRDPGLLTQLQDSLPQAPTHQSLSLDLQAVEAIEAQLAPSLAALGALYGFCHCAGTVDSRPFKLIRPAALQQQLTVNALAGLELARICSLKNHMPGAGSLLFISSIYASLGAPGQIGYCASKGMLNAAARAMALELAPRGLRVNSLSPGFVATDMTLTKARLAAAQLQAILDKHPLGAGRPEDVARAAVFLLSPANSWVTGTDLVVDGGYSAQ